MLLAQRAAMVIVEGRLRMPLYLMDRAKEEASKEQRPPCGVAVFTLHYSTVCSACMHLHCLALCISDRSSSNDRASIVEGALARIFQLFRDEIDYHTPPCTAIVWKEQRSPNHKAAKAFIHKYQAWRLVLKPGRITAPSRLLTPTRGSMRTEICRAF
jgi:hypothetical protein